MSEISDISSILQNSLLLTTLGYNGNGADKLQTVQDKLKNINSVLDKDTLTKLKNGEFEVTLKDYTNMTTYSTMMNALYGNNSANKFQSTLNILTNSAEDNLATAKAFVNNMKANGMSNETAVRTYTALQKYSLLSSFDNNYNFVNANI